MRRKLSTKIISAVMALVLVAGSILPVSAADFKRTDPLTINLGVHTIEDDADEIQYPTIVLPGLSFSRYYLLDENGEKVKKADGTYMCSGSFIVDKDALLDEVKKAIIPLIKSLIFQRDFGLSQKVFDLVTLYTQYELCDANGDLIYDLDLETYDYPMSKMDPETKQYYYDNVPIKDYGRIVGEDMLYMYTYCPFGEIMEQAKNLVPYIDMVLEQTGAEKVNLLTMSMGTTILDAYLDLDEADYSKLNHVVNIVPIFDGNEVITEMLAKDFTTDDEFYSCEFLPTIAGGVIGNENLGYVLNLVVRLLPESVRREAVTKLYDALANAFAYSSQAWTMVQSSRYQELREMYLEGAEHDKLRANTDRFFEAQANLKTNLVDANENYGVEFFNLAAYGIGSAVSFSSLFAPIRSNKNTNSDCLVPLSSSSLGATFSNRTTTLSDEYIASLPTAKYLSPDKTVDASTCLFKDTTWFYYKQCHWCGGNDAVIGLAILAVLGVIDNIDSDPENYPQFNGCRDFFDASDSYMYMAEDVLKNSGKYAPAAVAKVQKAFDAIKKLYANTNLLSGDNAKQDAENATYDLALALYRCGVCDKPEKVKTTPGLTRFLDNVSRTMYKAIGRKGYFEVNRLF